MKPVVYEPIPEYNQETQYILQLEPIEKEGCIYYGIEIKDLEIDELRAIIASMAV